MLAIAHRGFSAGYIENTAIAFEKAIETGADYIETDLRFSSDGAIICCHDDNFERVAGVSKHIHDLSLAEIQTIRLPEGMRILTLPDVLAIAKGRAKVMLDVKLTTQEMASAALAAASVAGMTEEVIYGARSPEIARFVKASSPATKVLAMPTNAADFEIFLGMPVDAFRLYEDSLDPVSVAAIQAAGHPLWVTGGRRPDGEDAGTMTAERLEKLAALPAAAVLLNDPTLITLRQAA
jgi:glycerophosphoryl diester phosphodiesterase